MYRSGQRNTGGSCHRLSGRPPEVPNLRRNIAFYNKQLSQPPDCRTYSAEVTWPRQQSPASSRFPAFPAGAFIDYIICPFLSRGFAKNFCLFLRPGQRRAFGRLIRSIQMRRQTAAAQRVQAHALHDRPVFSAEFAPFGRHRIEKIAFPKRNFLLRALFLQTFITYLH